MTDPLLEDLLGTLDVTSRLSMRVGPSERLLLLANFLECLEEALGTALGKAAIPVDRWAVELEERSVPTHQAEFGLLRALRERRNQPAHPNAPVRVDLESELNAYRAALRGCSYVLYGALARFGKHDAFATALWAGQRALHSLMHGRDFEAAVTNAFTDDARRAEKLLEASASVIAASTTRADVERVPLARRVRFAVVRIARTNDPLSHFVACAQALLGMGPDDERPLQSWLVSVGSTGAVPRVCVVLRVTVSRPAPPGLGYCIDEAMLVAPSGVRLAPKARGLHAETTEELVACLHRVRISFQLTASELRELVLQLVVPPELALEPFEQAAGREYRLLTMFSCIAVCPSMPERFESATLGGVVAYPNESSASARFDSPPLGLLGDDLLGKLSVFATKHAWQPANGNAVSRFVEAFGPFPLAVLEHAGDLDNALEQMFAKRHEQPIAEFFARIKARRLGKERVTLLWDDEQHSPPLAVSV